jgi:prevent-host-death family protein
LAVENRVTGNSGWVSFTASCLDSVFGAAFSVLGENAALRAFFDAQPDIAKKTQHAEMYRVRIISQTYQIGWEKIHIAVTVSVAKVNRTLDRYFDMGKIRVSIRPWITIIDYADKIEPVSVLKSRSAELIRRVRDTGQPIVITQNGKAACVLQDMVSFERQRKVLLLLKALVEGDQDYKNGRSFTHKQAQMKLEESLKEFAKNGGR